MHVTCGNIKNSEAHTFHCITSEGEVKRERKENRLSSCLLWTVDCKAVSACTLQNSTFCHTPDA